MRSLSHHLGPARTPAVMVAVLTVLASCGSTAATPDWGAGDMARHDGPPSIDAAMTPPDFTIASTPDLASPPNPDLAISCPTVFPAFDKTCSNDADCFIALHQINCCGTQVALGYNVGAQAAFAGAERTCDAMYPGCGCAQGPTAAEDGRTDAQGKIAVRCSTGQCNT